MATLSQRPRSRRIQARLIRVINVPTRRLLGLPFPTPLGSRLVLVYLTGRHYRQSVSCVRHEDTLLTPLPEKATESSAWYKTSRSTDRDVPASAAGALRHFAGLLGPTGAVAGRVVVERDLPLRVARLKDAARSRWAPIEPMRAMVAGPGGRLRWRAAKAPRPPARRERPAAGDGNL